MHKSWKLTWCDDFKNGEINPNYWNLQVEKAGRFNQEWQRYTNSSKNAYVENNCLVLKAIHEGDHHGHNQYTSARLNTAQKITFTYGKIEARIKLPEGKGIWPAFWMLGNNIDENGGDTLWPFCGEIDILELYGSRDDGAVEANLHYADLNGMHSQMGEKVFTLPKGKFSDDFHVFSLEWNSHTITWFVDGVAYASLNIQLKEFDAFHKDFFLLFNIAVGGEFSGRPDDSTPFPQCMYIDWVKLYQLENEHD
ncbi:MAG: glycoside hydrolase family 16 protein [bacterium]